MELLDITDAPATAAADEALDPYTARGLEHAAAGDWHAAAQAFEMAVDVAERERIADVSRDHDAHEARLAAALTNLGQARAHQGSLDVAVALLRRGVAVRERMHATGAAGSLVVARALVDLGAVLGAAGETAEARDVLRRAQTLAAGARSALVAAIGDGIALLADPDATDLPLLSFD
jgi:tetratricopeptide (TPR) repeat protein